MMKLLALVLLVTAFSSLTLTEVVKDFNTDCPQFFYPKDQNVRIIPTVTGDQYKMICQRWKNNYRFATLYDTVRRIPVYSAYTVYWKKTTKRCNKSWKIEPQLEDIIEYKEKKEMITSPKNVKNIKNQAVDSDYTGSNYTRGHVFPCSFAADQDQADSTFTLTNIAPQTEHSNTEWARLVETPMLKLIIEECKLNQNDPSQWAYILTGVVAGDKWISITRANREDNGINIPRLYWSVFCCTSIKGNGKLISKAYIAEQEHFAIEQMTVNQLNKKLSKLYKDIYKKHVDFNVFPGLNL